MEKDINCINFKGLFGYIENRFGKAIAVKLVEDALGSEGYEIPNKNRPDLLEPVTIEHLTDPSYWISNTLSLSLLSRIKTVVPGPTPEQTAGKGAVLETLSKSDLFFAKLLGPKALAKKAARVNRKFNRTKDVKISSLTDTSVTVELHYRKGVKVTRDVCNWNLGIYDGIAEASGARSVRVTEVKCILRGDDHCEIRVDWQVPSLFKRFYVSFLKLFARDLIAEYEKTVDDRDSLIEELSASERKYRLLIENQPDLVIKLDNNGRFQFASPSYCRMFGKPASRLTGQKITDHVYKGDREEISKNIRALYHPPHSVRVEQRAMTTLGLKWFSWVGTAVFDNKKNVIAVTAVGRDITEHKLVEEALKKSETLFKLITGYTSALVSIHDSSPKYIFASPSHRRLGYAPEELVGGSSFTMLVKEDAPVMLEALNKARKGTLSKAFVDYRLRGKNSEIHHFRGAFDAVFASDGTLEKIICVGEDITELRQAQVQREKALSMAAESKKLALVGQVAGKMSHDFNNILGIIMGISELALLDSRDKAINKSLEMIRDQSMRGKTLTKNLVAFAKSQEPKQEFFQINEKIGLVLELMRKDLEKIAVKADLAPDMPDLLADPAMVQHALVNLVQNAVHALSKKERPEIRIRTFCRDRFINFEIEDNGCGIPREHLKNIYEPSFTLKGSKDVVSAYENQIKGTGYGMANVKKYIRQHNGKVTVDSVEGSGTRVVVSLPVIQKELSPGEKTELGSESPHTGKSILLVEDEKVISDVQFRILTQDPCRHKVDIAYDGPTAMEMFDKNHYDLISLDYVLPGRVNGMGVYMHIRQADTSVPIVFVSGNLEFLESVEELRRKDPCLAHLSKPCGNMDYLSCINRLFTRSQQPPGEG